MPECPVPKSKEDFERNFEQIKPLMNDTEAYYESSRCLFCYNAPCTEACPTHIDIPLFIRQINTGNVIGAAETIYRSNYMGAACGKVCPVEVLCEGACVYNNRDVKPIEIGRLQFFATTAAMRKKAVIADIPPSNGKKVAVIGAGPSGIACACELRTLGYDVDIYEAEENPSGLTLYGIAPYKITNREVLDEMEYLQGLFGFTLHYNRPIMTRADLDTLESDYDAVMIGIGLGQTISTSLPGEDLKGCIGATEFIKELKMSGPKVTVGKEVVVLGGGNTAMDAASEAARLGAENITLVYRRSKREKKAYEFEYDLAKSVGVKGIFNASPVEVLGEGQVEGVKLIKTESSGGKLVPIPGSEFTIECDMVIRATGQQKKVEFLKQISGLEIDTLGCIVADRGTGRTGNPRYFAGGDAVNGGAEVVNAAAEGKIAALGIHAYVTEGENNG